MIYLLVALAVACSDAIWALYFRMIAQESPHGAGATSVAILLVNAFVVHSYMTQPKLLLAAAVGAYIGTSATVWVTKKLKQ